MSHLRNMVYKIIKIIKEIKEIREIKKYINSLSGSQKFKMCAIVLFLIAVIFTLKNKINQPEVEVDRFDFEILFNACVDL